MIQPVVEGEGEEEAVPVLLRRLLSELGVYDVAVGRPIVKDRTLLVREANFKATMEIATLVPGVRAILVLFDSDDDCARNLLPSMTRWANEVTYLPCAIVLARREYEAWFLAAIESLRGARGIRDNAAYPQDPEAKRNAKQALRRFMPRNVSYSPRLDQPALSARFDSVSGYEPVVPTEWTRD